MLKHSYRALVTASAGTGKTYSLVENYLSALFGNDGTGEKKRPSEILALTFTQKAANEMRLRITTQLSNLVVNEDGDNFDDRFPSFDKDEVRRILRAIPNAPISTFHGFCATLLRREARSLKIDENFDILSTREELVLARSVLRTLILSEIAANNSVVRNLVARFRLKSGFLSLGLIDGLLSAYFKLSEKGICYGDLLSLTELGKIELPQLFASLDNVFSAINRFLDSDPTKATRDRLLLARDQSFLLKESLSRGQEFQVAQDFLHLRTITKGNFGDRTLRSELVSEILRLGASLVNFYVFEDECSVARILEKFHADFDRLKLTAHKLSYADLLLKTKQTLLDNPALRKRIKLPIKHILVDEYQDTSPVQEDILALLLENKNIDSHFSASVRVINSVDFTTGSSLFVVGDSKQSIYGFRGADASLMEDLTKKLATTRTKEEEFSERTLRVNRRSSTRIIDLVNKVVISTPVLCSNSDDAELLSHDTTPGACGLWVLKNAKDLDLDRSTSNLTCAAFGIVKLLKNRSDLQPKDIVVLIRRINSASLIKQKLTSFGIPARVVGGDGFFQQQEIVDVLSLLRLINNPNDSLSLGVVLRSPLVLLKDDEIFSIKDSVEGPLSLSSLALFLTHAPRDSRIKTRVGNFFKMLDKIKSVLVEEGLVAALDIIIDDADYSYALGLTDHHDQKWANMEKLSTMFAKDARNPFVAIDDYYARISEDLKEPLASGNTLMNAVTIMTIHQSKGLEWNVVVLADTESAPVENHGDFLVDRHQGISLRPKGRHIGGCGPKDAAERSIAKTRFDQFRERQIDQESEELARILYVAITRAKKELYVACSHQSYFEAPKKGSLIALFLDALRSEPDELLTLCDFEEIKEPEPVPLSSESMAPIFANVSILEKSPENFRLFASSLRAGETSGIHRLINHDVNEDHTVFDGNLAHKLIATAGDMLFSGDFPNAHLINAATRSLGVSHLETNHVVKEKVAATLNVLTREFLSAQHLIFEMPLNCWPQPHIMIEGFADVVALFDDKVRVLEFKSSRRLATHPDTYFQVLAYAHALSLQCEKPIQFATALVGDVSPIKWLEYDEVVKELFLREVRPT